ncbi:hypothetical protein [Mycobacterium shigaense]|uniref:Uncharacterized protein n=1 Tax=Mycobacterium shigaense TaxID=722731 RepID=A0A1Z4EF89_9MYCO|nr:hypothetical protein [Mycobacterium shigaense]MEA1122176.1 hypothetical protein [Mycobacterium shigaense]PRI16363.1 hypothetical protein B2J96_06140 [Mycobacterium shigaense]BAX91622.1 hypothetical protein MSG_01466 [Mycobacterium shigaense]
MKARSYARGLVAGAISVLALCGATGLASADPDTEPEPPMLPELGQFNTIDGPSFFTNPADRGRPLQKNWDGVGNYCQNIFIRCGY